MAENNHNQDQNINSKDFLLGTIIGGIVGASVALLFAPKSGRELRQDINQGADYVRERAEEWKDVAAEKSAEWKTVALEKTEGLGERVKNTKNQIQDKVYEFRSKSDDVEDAVEDIADAIEEAAEELEKNK